MPTRCPIAILSVVLAQVVGCDEPKGTTLCLLPTSDAGPPSCDESADAALPPIRGGESYWLIHTVDSHLEPAEVLFRFDTPCGVSDERILNTDGKVSVVRVAPPGAECGFAVTASLFQSSVRKEAAGGDCEGIDDTCAAARAADSDGDDADGDAGDAADGDR
jgi:hypothetical protein